MSHTGPLTWQEGGYAVPSAHKTIGGYLKAHFQDDISSTGTIVQRRRPPPGPLAEGWEEILDDSGLPYYFNTETGVSQWERPQGPSLRGRQQAAAAKAKKRMSPKLRLAVEQGNTKVEPPAEEQAHRVVPCLDVGHGPMTGRLCVRC